MGQIFQAAAESLSEQLCLNAQSSGQSSLKKSEAYIFFFTFQQKVSLNL